MGVCGGWERVSNTYLLSEDGRRINTANGRKRDLDRRDNRSLLIFSDVVLPPRDTGHDDGIGGCLTQEGTDIPRDRVLNEPDHGQSDNTHDGCEEHEGPARLISVSEPRRCKSNYDCKSGRWGAEQERQLLAETHAVLQNDGQEEQESVDSSGAGLILKGPG